MTKQQFIFDADNQRMSGANILCYVCQMFLFGSFCHAHGHTQGAWLAWWMCVPTKIYKERCIQVNAAFAFWYSWYTSWAITVCRPPIKEICTASEVGSRTKKLSDSCVEIFEGVHSLHFGRYSICSFCMFKVICGYTWNSGVFLRTIVVHAIRDNLYFIVYVCSNVYAHMCIRIEHAMPVLFQCASP